MKCLKGCEVKGVQYEPGDELPDDLPAKTVAWLASKGCCEAPKKKGKK